MDKTTAAAAPAAKPKRPLPAHLEKFKFQKGHKRATKPAAAAAPAPAATPKPATPAPAPDGKIDWNKFWS